MTHKLFASDSNQALKRNPPLLTTRSPFSVSPGPFPPPPDQVFWDEHVSLWAGWLR